MCNQTNTLVNTANQNTLSLRDGATANTNAILAKLDAIQNQALHAAEQKQRVGERVRFKPLLHHGRHPIDSFPHK